MFEKLNTKQEEKELIRLDEVKKIKARTNHLCVHCKTRISSGTSYWSHIVRAHFMSFCSQSCLAEQFSQHDSFPCQAIIYVGHFMSEKDPIESFTVFVCRDHDVYFLFSPNVHLKHKDYGIKINKITFSMEDLFGQKIIIHPGKNKILDVEVQIE